ncbi:MAG: CoA transferase [Proteobacteria bacterium]|nr:CoA transferase [Pseudomonadota bacterium]
MGPLHGFKIIEIAGIGPSQFCGMLLADMGAEILRIDRPQMSGDGITIPTKFNLMNRSRQTLSVDLKKQEGVDLVLTLCQSADAFFEGFRPGVMERMGLGPEECLQQNGALVYGRMTGWGQEGPLAKTAGHDADYIALVGALAAIGNKDQPPAIPLNLIGDFGGGGAFLAIGILAALLETSRSGEGQVVDAAMTDGAASLMTMFYGLRAGGLWSEERGSNFLDGAAPFYRSYQTRDERSVVVCALEGRFYRELLRILSLNDIDPDTQHDRSTWPTLTKRLETTFATKTRDEWCKLFAETDACFAPILSMSDAITHPHNKARNTFVEIDGITQPAPAPRFSRSESKIKHAPPKPIKPTTAVLKAWDVPDSTVEEWLKSGTVDP